MRRLFQRRDSRYVCENALSVRFQLGNLRREDRFLFLAAAAGLQPAQVIEELITPELDWERLLQSAVSNRLVVVLSRFLFSNRTVPKHILSSLHLLVLSLHGSVAAEKEEFERILPLITGRNRIILLRGIAYVYTIYKNWPIRQIGDVDLLVDKVNTTSLFGHIGDHLIVPNEVKEKCSLLYLEYHRDLNINSWWYSRMASLPMSELWGRSMNLTVAGNAVGVLSAEDNLIYLSYHNVSKGFSRLYRFVDMLSIIAQSTLDWGAVVERSKRYKLSRPVWANCLVLNMIRPGTIPAEVISQLQPGRMIRWLVGCLFSAEQILQEPRPSGLLVRVLLARPGVLHKVLLGDLFRWAGSFTLLLYGSCLSMPIVGRICKRIVNLFKRIK
jgi:hypothetical protein